MKRMLLLCLCCLFVSASTNLYAKVIYVGIGGGPNMFIGDGSHISYIPNINQHPGAVTPDDVATEPLGHGLDAIAVYLQFNLCGNYNPIIFTNSASASTVVNWITRRYLPGDKVYLVGYSAGGGIALKTARKLYSKNVPIEVMGLIDKFSHVRNRIKSNVENVYVYHQDEKSLHGQSDFIIQDPAKTVISITKIDNTSHTAIDNDPRVWKSLAEIMVDAEDMVCLEKPVFPYEPPDEDPTCQSSNETVQAETCTVEAETSKPGKNRDRGVPDMDIHRSKLGNGQFTKRHRRLEADPNESIYGFVKLRNKGTGHANDAEVSFYLDAGDIDFKREDKDFIDSHYIGTFRAKQETWYVVGFRAPKKKGKYTFYGCVDNSGDKRYKNNCPIIDNEQEYARLTVTSDYVEPPVEEPTIEDPVTEEPNPNDPVENPDQPTQPNDPVDPDPQPVQTITVTNPDSSDEWRSDEGLKNIRWETTNISSNADLKVEYSFDGGSSWHLVNNDPIAKNDGSREWDMCGDKTEDSSHSFVKVTLISNSAVYDISDEFTIDHAAGCE